jgi:hypothetical protein
LQGYEQRKQLFELAKKYGYLVGGGLTLDSWRISLQAKYQDQYMKEAINNGLSREEALTYAKKKAEHALTRVLTDMTVKATELDVQHSDVANFSGKIDTLIAKKNGFLTKYKPDSQEIRNIDLEIKYNLCF